MDTQQFFNQALEQANGCIKAVKSSDLGNPTPCTEWDLRALLNHIVYEVLWLPELLSGKTIAEVGGSLDGDLLGDDPIKAWEQACQKALAAVRDASLDAKIQLSYGETSAEKYIGEVGIDVLIHGWDVAQAIQCSQIFEPSLAQAAYDRLAPSIDASRAGGAFAEEVEVPADASIQVKLLAIAGRKSAAPK